LWQRGGVGKELAAAPGGDQDVGRTMGKEIGRRETKQRVTKGKERKHFSKREKRKKQKFHENRTGLDKKAKIRHSQDKSKRKKKRPGLGKVRKRKRLVVNSTNELQRIQSTKREESFRHKPYYGRPNHPCGSSPRGELALSSITVTS